MNSLHLLKRPGICVALTLAFFLASAGNLVAATFVQDPSNRVAQNLNMNWKFQLGNVTGAQAVTFDDAAWTTVSLPCPLKIVSSRLDGSQDCNTQATFDRTTGWYRKHFTLTGQSGKKVFIEFQTVMEVATVYVNGTLVGKHEISGYDGFFYDITNYVSFTGDNVVAVFVDNNVNTNTPPDWNYNGACNGYPDGMDYILFGGINGDVILHNTDKLHIGFQVEAKNAGIVVTTPTVSATSATVKVVTTVKNEYTISKTATVVATVIDANNQIVTTLTSTAQIITAGSAATITLTSAAIANPHLWSTNDPYLYKVYVSVLDGSTPVDGKYQRFGFRWVDFNTTTGFHLNGQSVKLIGVDRHSAWPFVGGAIPNTVHRREAQQIKSFGFNWIRLSHYPHDPEFLDALDELGIMAMEEAPTWAQGNAPNDKTTNATWVNNMVTSFTKMIRRDINHPCIILWNSCINHGGCYAALRDAAGTEDPTRKRGQCDVSCPMCFNMNPNETVAGNGGICIEMVGFRQPTARFDRDEFNVTYAQWHMRMVNLSRATPANSGVAAWEMYDNNSFHASGLTAPGYPGTYTAANRNIVFQGLADLYRIPKLVLYWYKSELTTTPMVYIANYWTATSPRIATVYSNCAQVELFVNGTSVGKIGPSNVGDSVSSLLHPPFYFRNLSNATGSLIALGYNGGGQVIARDTVLTPGAVARLKIESDADTLLADGADFARLTVSVCDANGTIVHTAVNSISASATGAGTVISPSPIAAEGGQIIFLARANTVGGTMTVTASSGNLTSASKTITVVAAPSTGVSNNAVVRQTGYVATNQPRFFFTSVGNRIVLPASLVKMSNAVEVFDVRGKLVLKTAITNNTRMIDLSKTGKADGVFVVKAIKELL